MEIIEAIRNRRSMRGFKPDPVPKDILERILSDCLWVPNNRNMQPWKFYILGGRVMGEIKARLEEKTRAEWDGTEFRNIHTDIPRVADLPNPYKQRAVDTTHHIDAHQFPPGTENLAEKRYAYLLKGGRFHDAPNGIILCIEEAVGPVAIFDAGVIAQTISLAALAYGLGTCHMGRVVYWPELLREPLGIPKTELIVEGIAIGYPDPEALVNSYPRSREPLDTFARWCGF